VIIIDKWPGLVTNASKYAIPPGATVEQVNVQCLVPGQLTVRPGLQAVAFANTPGATAAIVSAVRYQHGSGEHIVYQNADGNIFSSVVPASSATLASAPSAPRITSARPGDSSIAVVVSAPSASGGSPVTGYAFQVSTNSGATWTAAGASSALTYTVAGLLNGTAYLVRAAATNAYGTGDYSSSYGPVTPVGAVVGPAAPPPAVVAAASAANTATITWQIPASTGGSAITGYRVQSSGDRGGTWTTVADVGTVFTTAVTGLAGSTDYVFRVAAVTSYGAGQYSNPSNSVTVLSSASTPTAVRSLAAVPTTTTIPLTWIAPASQGSSAIIDYQVRAGDSTFTTTGTSYTVTSLTPGSTYVIQVAARNALGVGEWATITRTTQATASDRPPSAVTAFTLVGTSDGFTASWSAPSSDGGSAITSYRVTYIPSADYATGKDAITLLDTLATSATATGLTPGVRYDVTVFAINSVGQGPASALSVVVGGTPSAPQNVTAAPVGNTSAKLTWQAPAQLYEQTISSYLIQWASLGAIAQTNVAGNLLTYQIDNLTAGATYTFTIRAITLAGQGQAATASATMPASAAVPPSAPRNYVLTATDGGFVASWDAPASTGDSPIIGYKTYVLSGASWVLKDTREAGSRNYQASGYPNGVSVSVRTSAYSVAGESAFATGTVTPYTTPSAVTGLNFTRGFQCPGGGCATYVTLRWTAPSSLGGLALIRYRVFADGVPVDDRWVDRPTPTTAYLQMGAATQTFTVAAETSAGIGPPSNAVTVNAIVFPVAPSAPTLAIISQASGQVQFTVYSPLPSGMSLISYQGQFSVDNGASWNSAALSGRAIEGNAAKFTATIPYVGTASRAVLVRSRATVTADGGDASGPWSDGTATTVTFSAPVFAPQITYESTGKGKARISWTAPSSDGGSPITGYAVRYLSSAGATAVTQTVSASTLSAIITRTVTSGDSVQVVATNAIGSTTATLSLPARFAGPASILVDADSVTRNVFLLAASSSPPAGQQITSYRWYSSADNVTWVVAGETAASGTSGGRYIGLTNQPGGRVYYKVVAITASAESEPATASKPVPPASVVFSSADITDCLRATVSWSYISADGGAPITSYIVEQGEVTSTESSPASWQRVLLPSPLTTSATVFFSNMASQHYVRVTPVNAAGPGLAAQLFAGGLCAQPLP